VSVAALALVLLSAFLHASWNAAAKGSRNPAAFLFVADLAGCLLFLPLLALVDFSLLTREIWLLVLATGVVHGFYSWALTRAYEVADLSLVYPISRSTPAFVPLLAVPLLGEHVAPLGALGIAAVLAGVWLVQTDGRLSGAGWRQPGLAWAYLTLATTVIYSLVDKQAMVLLDAAAWVGPVPRSVAFYWLLAASHLPFFWALAHRRLVVSELRAVLSTQLLLVIGAVVASLASYSLILEALRTAPVSYVVAARQSSVVFAVLLGLVWLRERPSRPRVVGALLTVAGVALLALA
jgi:drug/metabolite transporter (DMT)-like permease